MSRHIKMAETRREEIDILQAWPTLHAPVLIFGVKVCRMWTGSNIRKDSFTFNFLLSIYLFLFIATVAHVIQCHVCHLCDGWMDVRMDVLILSLDVWTYNWTKFNQKWVGACGKTQIQDTFYSEDDLQRYGCNRINRAAFIFTESVKVWAWTCGCKYEYLIMHTVWQDTLLIIHISIQGLPWQRVRTSTRPSLAGDAILGHCIRNQRDMRTCEDMCQKFINKGEGRQRETLTFFPGGTRFWLVLRMCVRAFLMFFSFMLDSTAGGRNSERPHSFLWKKKECKVLPQWDLIFRMSRGFSCF